MKTKEEIVKDWLPRYTGRPLNGFGKYILLTNFIHYVELFAAKFKVPVEGLDKPMQTATANGITIINFGMGSANAATCMDLLSAVAPKAVLFLGKCGGLKKKTKLGDLILPIAAIRGDGTSNDYIMPEIPALPSFRLQKAVSAMIVKHKLDYWTGTVYTTNRRVWEHDEEFKKYHGIKKIFYGGEHFSISQRDYLKKEYGVEVIRSASYGSVDAGPLAYQCEYSQGGVHHLHEKLHELEVVDLEVDKRVSDGEVGRLLFTSKVRHGQRIERYAIGDVGKILSGPCKCGRQGVRFELLGRHGDVFRIGTTFLSYQKFQKILIDKLEFVGSIQLHLYPGDGVKKELVELKIENLFNVAQTPEGLSKLLLDEYNDLDLVVNIDKVLDFKVIITEKTGLAHSSSTGKLRSVIDHRNV